MNSGEFARLAGVTPRTLRHYRKLGLLPNVAAGENGYYDYTLGDLLRLLWVRNLTALGFSLAEIKEMAQEEADDGARMAALDRDLALRIAELEEQRRMLALLQKYDLPAGTPVNFARLVALLAAHDYPEALLQREVDMLRVADHLLDEETLTQVLALYEALIDSGHFDDYCTFGVALDGLRAEDGEAEKTRLAEMGMALFSVLFEEGCFDRAALAESADAAEANGEVLDALFRAYDGEAFYDAQTEVTARILAALRKKYL